MSIREVNAVAITDAVEELCIRANTQLPPDVKQALDNAHAAEPWPLARQTLELLQQNLCVAAEKDLPICQDTGMACVFIELGQDVHINGNLDEAVNEGVRRGYEKAYLRKSITADPLQRVNTGDNTPAFLTVHLVPGDVCKITVAPKGAGSENMSRLTMLKPADGVQGVKDFMMETVKQAEDGDGVIVRLYECENARTTTKLHWNRPIASVTECDLQENALTDVPVEGGTFKFTIKPYEIKTFRIR